MMMWNLGCKKTGDPQQLPLIARESLFNEN
jgi:hypothetical protein